MPEPECKVERSFSRPRRVGLWYGIGQIRLQVFATVRILGQPFYLSSSSQRQHQLTSAEDRAWLSLTPLLSLVRQPVEHSPFSYDAANRAWAHFQPRWRLDGDWAGAAGLSDSGHKIRHHRSVPRSNHVKTWYAGQPEGEAHPRGLPEPRDGSRGAWPVVDINRAVLIGPPDRAGAVSFSGGRTQAL